MDTAKRINKLHSEITILKQKTLDQISECGRLLIKERDRRPGTYLTWLKTNVHFSERTAHKYMRVHRLIISGDWSPSKTVAENLRENAIPELKKSLSSEFKLQKIQKIAPELKQEQALKIANTFKDIEPRIAIFDPELGEGRKKQIRICIFNAMENSHLLGRKDKILTIEEKRKTYQKIINIIERSK